jgi:hypothetical protein
MSWRLKSMQRVSGMQVTLRALLTVSLVVGGSTSWAGRRNAPSAKINITSDPPGATVYVDGRERGQAPLRITALTPGDHAVRVVSTGYLENQRTVTLAPGQSMDVVVRLLRGHSQDSAARDRGGSRKWVPIAAIGAAAVGAAVYLATKKSNTAPVAGTVSTDPTTALMGATSVSFGAQGFSDPDKDPLTYSWDFGDGSTGSGATTTHTYTSANTYTVRATATDGKLSSSATGSVNVKSMTGRWRVTYVGYSSIFDAVLQLTQSGTTISGTGTQLGGTFSVAGSVSAPREVRVASGSYSIIATGNSGLDEFDGRDSGGDNVKMMRQ